MINEFTAKKLGEVLAFATVGGEIFTRGQAALEVTFMADGVAELKQQMQAHVTALTDLATTLGTAEITLPKSEKTSAKLRQMMELYIGDQWDNPAELLEWLGFFEGAADIHWQLVHGAGETLANQDIISLADTGIGFHQQLLKEVGTAIHKIGSTKAAA